MKHFIVYNKDGRILRTGSCPDKMLKLQASSGEFVTEGLANDAVQKMIGGKVVDKTPEEIEAEQPPDVPEEQKPANITKGEWQDVKDRLATLEAKRI